MSNKEPIKVWTGDDIYSPLYESIVHKKSDFRNKTFIATEDVIEIIKEAMYIAEVNEIEPWVERKLQQLQEKPRSGEDVD